MKKLLITLIMLTTSTLFALADASTSQRISLEPLGSNHMQAGNINYTFQLVDNTSKKTLSDTDLIESHTKKLHFITYDVALKEFRHVHPTFNDGNWSVALDLPVDGNYFFWAQGMLVDKQEFSVLTQGMVMGGKPQNPIQPIGDVRTGIDRNTKIVLEKTKIKSGKMAMLGFTISRTDGKAPVLSPYLGAFAHVIATPTDGNELTHVHPAAGNKPNTGMLHSTFPTEGSYRLWVQLIDGGELKTIPLSVIVTK